MPLPHPKKKGSGLLERFDYISRFTSSPNNNMRSLFKLLCKNQPMESNNIYKSSIKLMRVATSSTTNVVTPLKIFYFSTTGSVSLG